MNLVELSIAKPDDAEHQAAMTAMTYANTFSIESASDSVKAQEARARIATRAKAINDLRLSMTRPIDEAKKKVMEVFAPTLALLGDAKVIFDRKILAWDELQQKIRKEAQRKEEEKAAAERARLQTIADEAARKAAAEAKAKREAAEKAAAEGRAAEAAKLLAQAERVEERGAAKVENFETRAATVVATIVPAETAKASGVSFRDNWKWRLKDKAKINQAFLMTIPNEAAIDAMVKSMKADAVSVVGDGIEVYNERILASRRA